jgi:hypothetical protein
MARMSKAEIEKHKGADSALGKRARLALILDGMHGAGKADPKHAGDTRKKNARVYDMG